jgi:beta-glucanase (GH16 family)
VRTRRSLAAAIVLAAISAVLVPVAAIAFPTASLRPAGPRAARAPRTALVREAVAAVGVYEVRVTVETTAPQGAALTVGIGPLRRRARVADGHRAVLALRLAINRRRFSVRVPDVAGGDGVRIALRRTGALAPGTVSGSISLAAASNGGRTLASGVVAKRADDGATGATGPTGASAASGTVASSTNSASQTTPSSPPSQPPLTATFAPDGAPILQLPNGFAPIINYTNPVKDYEFTGSSLPSDWVASANFAHGMQTMYQPSQVTLTGSSVALTAIDSPSDGYPTTSGWIDTEGHYSLNYGLIDFRAEMPAGQGLWPGLWLDQPDGSNPWGELDVMEMLLNDTHTVYGSAHGWAPSQWGETQSTVMAADASQGFHDYQLAWQPGLLTWAIDGIAYAQYTEAQALASGYPWIFDDGTGFYLIADLSVGTASEWGGAPNSSTQFPATMQVQYVKVWQ